MKYVAMPVALLCAANLAAQPRTPTPVRVEYAADFYAAFAPRTALDMINQTPGFVLSAPEEDERRGFSGAVGNVLIDGERLGAKSQSLRDVLNRVPAKEVLRIEILRGAEVAGDASGSAVLANVVRTPTAGGGTWQGGVEVTNEHVLAPNGKFGWSGRRETTEYSVGGTMYTHDHTSTGDGNVTDGSGARAAHRFSTIPHQQGEYALNGQAAWQAGGGRLTLTGQAALFEYDEQFSRLTTTPALVQVENERAPYHERTPTAEAGLTWQRSAGRWDMNFTTLATRKRVRYQVSSTHLDAADLVDEQIEQEVRQDSGESILRGTFTRALTSGRIELGAEIAVNTLDGTTLLTQDLGAGPVPVDLPNANVSVEENRAEAFASHVWRMSEAWSLDSRLAVEASRLTFTGDTEQSVSLSYVKPRVQLARRLGSHQLVARVFRDVGQLDFADFVSTASLADNNINGGNPDLKPQTEWTAELEADLRFAGDAALRVRLFKNFLDDVVDFVPFGPPDARFDAPGNIGAGTIVGTEISLRMPLASLLTGGTLNIAGKWRDSAVTDPVTGEERRISDFPQNTIQVQLRQDLNAVKLAWGMNYGASSKDMDFRLDEIDSFREIHPRLDLFVETTAIANLKLRLEMQSALTATELRERRFYEPDRNGPLVAREITEFQPGHWWLFTMSSTF